MSNRLLAGAIVALILLGVLVPDLKVVVIGGLLVCSVTLLVRTLRT